MRKLIRTVTFCALLWSLLWCGTLFSDRQRLSDELVRLHVLANSDTQADQTVKLKVRDAITAYLNSTMADITDAESAKEYIRGSLPVLQQIAEDVLESCGCDLTVAVDFVKEAFDTRDYDTFSLPAGRYDSLRITIGSGGGRNWWCVVFPSLCIPATSEGFEAEAVGAGFPDSLTCALEGEEGYEVRFFLLDVLGKLENIFCAG